MNHEEKIMSNLINVSPRTKELYEESKDINNNNDENKNEFQSAIRSMKSTHEIKLVLRCKVAIMGDPHVGKSALTQIFHSNHRSYPKNYIVTNSVDFSVKTIAIPGTNAYVELYLYDCAGQSIYNQVNITSSYWDDANYYLLVYDITNRESFQSLLKWIQLIKTSANNNKRNISIVLIANKIDLRQQGYDHVSREESLNFLYEQNLEDIFECSAFTCDGVDSPFQYIAAQFYQKYQETIDIIHQNT